MSLKAAQDCRFKDNISISIAVVSVHVTLKLSVCALTSAKENQGQSNSQGDGSQVNGLQTEELTQLREEVEELRKQHSLLQTQLSDKDALISSLVSIFFFSFLFKSVCAGIVVLGADSREMF